MLVLAMKLVEVANENHLLARGDGGLIQKGSMAIKCALPLPKEAGMKPVDLKQKGFWFGLFPTTYTQGKHFAAVLWMVKADTSSKGGRTSSEKKKCSCY